MKVAVINRQPTRTFAVIFDTGEEAASGLLRFARENQVRSASLAAIGAFSEVTLGFFDLEKKDYERIPVQEQVELLSLIGNIALHKGEPKLHAHVVLGRRDGSALGGHLLEARVRPTLEVIVVEAAENMVRRLDDETGLPLLASTE